MIHLFGENDPGCCDFFHYQIQRAGLPRAAGDFNFDGVVDAGDYVLGAKRLGNRARARSRWQRRRRSQRGRLRPLARPIREAVDFEQFADAELNAGAVPEPTTISLLLASCCFLLWRRK